MISFGDGGRDDRDGPEFLSRDDYDLADDHANEGPLDHEDIDDSAFVTSDELALRDEDESLPWLESAEEYDEDGSDNSKIIWFAAAALLGLVAILGGVWWATNRTASQADVVADGSTIEAPDAPYKERPENPGGRQVEGTGAVAPAVAEGQRPEGRIAENAQAPQPSIDTEQKTGEPQEPKEAPAPAPASGGVGVQVGAYSTKASAELGWGELTRRYEALQGFSHRVVQGQADIGTVYRLQAVAGSRAAANQLCDRLKAAGGACQVK